MFVLFILKTIIDFQLALSARNLNIVLNTGKILHIFAYLKNIKKNNKIKTNLRSGTLFLSWPVTAMRFDAILERPYKDVYRIGNEAKLACKK